MMIKNRFNLFISGVLTFTFFSFSAVLADIPPLPADFKMPFQDVPSDGWYATYVQGLIQDSVIDTSEKKYRPGVDATRAEAAEFLVKAADLQGDSFESSFLDIKPGDPHFLAIQIALQNGILTGYKDAAGNLTGKFGPNDPITREQFAKIAVNALDSKLMKNIDGGPHFPDIAKDRWSYEFVETLHYWGVIQGYKDGTFGPEKHINRAEMAKMVFLSMYPNPIMEPTAKTLDVAGAYPSTPTQLTVSFNEDIDKTTAEKAANYVIKDANGKALAVTAAEMIMAAPNGNRVYLTTAAQASNATYTIRVTGVKAYNGDGLNKDSITFQGFGGVMP